MKKILISMATLSLVAVSCTKVTEESAQNSIGFESSFVHNNVHTASVSEITTENLATFYVFGGYEDMTHVFNGTEVSKQSGIWSYSPTRFWVNGKNYHFAAYSPKIENGGTVEPDNSNHRLTFTDFIASTTQQIDLIYATANHTATASANEKIRFNFNHLLSMIKFTFKSGFGNDIKVTVSNLKAYGMGSKSTFSNGNWSDPTEDLAEGTAFNEISVPEAVNTSAGEKMANSGNFVVLPQTTDINISFHVSITDITGAEIASKDMTATVRGATWEMGKRYNYVATITGESVDLQAIEFGEPIVEEWGEWPEPGIGIE